MKKISREILERLKRLSIARARKQLKRARIKRHARRERDPYGSSYHRIQAPREFNIYNVEKRQKLLSFLTQLRDSVIVRNRPVKIDFTPTKKMYSCGTLLFLAELDRMLRLKTGNADVTCKFPRDKIVEQVLQQVGILKLFKRQSRIAAEDFDSTVRHWNFATCVNADSSAIDPMLTDFEGIMAESLQKSIYKGMTEAMTNSVHHAYLEGRLDGTGVSGEDSRWWLFSQEKDGMLTVVFCDLGIGIPRSLPREDGSDPGWLPKLAKYLKEQYEISKSGLDSLMIKAAIEIGRTRTKMLNRGKGLRQIVDAVNDTEGKGYVTIYSNLGSYNVASGREKLIQYESSIKGTLIQWCVPLLQET